MSYELRRGGARKAQALEESARGAAPCAQGDRARSLPVTRPPAARRGAAYLGNSRCRSAFADGEGTSRSHAARWPWHLRKSRSDAHLGTRKLHGCIRGVANTSGPVVGAGGLKRRLLGSRPIQPQTTLPRCAGEL